MPGHLRPRRFAGLDRLDTLQEVGRDEPLVCATKCHAGALDAYDAGIEGIVQYRLQGGDIEALPIPAREPFAVQFGMKATQRIAATGVLRLEPRIR